MVVKITVHGIQASGIDALTGKEGEAIVVSFEDGTVTESPLSQKSMMQLLRMKLGRQARPAQHPAPRPAVPAAVPVGNGPPK